MVVEYLHRGDRTEGTSLPYSCDYVFKVQGYQPKVSVVINGGWHEEVPSLSWKAAERELIAIAKEFLEKQLDGGWTPAAENNCLEIPNEEMEYRIRNGSFRGQIQQPRR